MELRGNTDALADWMLFIEGDSPLGSVFEQGPLGRDALVEMGAASVGNVTNYSLGALLTESEIWQPAYAGR